jgi:hypothetical protein
MELTREVAFESLRGRLPSVLTNDTLDLDLVVIGCASSSTMKSAISTMTRLKRVCTLHSLIPS